jgi:F-type H+-transporting ATPase subunit gamma
VSGATEGLGHKISGAQDLRMVVRSMKALAASNIAQYERAVAALQVYYRTVELAVRAASPAAAAMPPPKPPSRVAAVDAVIFGSDQGLVGRFNEVLMEFAARTLGEGLAQSTRLWAVGDRMRALAERANPKVRSLALPTSVDTIAPLVGQILIEVAAAPQDGAVAPGRVSPVYVFHNSPRGAARYEPVVRRLLPLDAKWQSDMAALHWPTPRVPELIESSEPALRYFIREYLFIVLFQACAESLGSENANRLAAMQRAEKNIETLLEEMNRDFHRIRQESIDEDLFEVIAGYDSLAQD